TPERVRTWNPGPRTPARRRPTDDRSEPARAVRRQGPAGDDDGRRALHRLARGPRPRAVPDRPRAGRRRGRGGVVRRCPARRDRAFPGVGAPPRDRDLRPSPRLTCVRYFDNVVELIGNTPLVRLRNVSAGIEAKVLARGEDCVPG